MESMTEKSATSFFPPRFSFHVGHPGEELLILSISQSTQGFLIAGPPKYLHLSSHGLLEFQKMAEP